MSSKKDPKKVEAGRKGGKASPSNFKHNKEAARAAGRKSAAKRHGISLEDFPLEYETVEPAAPKPPQLYESLTED